MINTSGLLFSLCVLLQYATSSNLGVYRGAAPYAPHQVSVFEQWLGRNVSWALDFTAIDAWSDLEGGGWQLGPWSTWVKSNPGKNFILSVGMVPNSPTNVTYAAGAAGAYNTHWTNLAKNLISYNLSSIYLRIGWEFDGNWMNWRASKDPKNWPLYWRQIVNSMRNVSGSNFKFVWCGNAGYVETNAEDVYPGDDYVDIIAVDSYDTSYNPQAVIYNFGYPQRGYWYSDQNYTKSDTVKYGSNVWRALVNNTNVQPVEGATWTLQANATQLNTSHSISWLDYYSGHRGLLFWAALAKNHSKPLGVAEWGLWDISNGHGGGDNPYYIQKMKEFLTNASNNVAFHNYFDVNSVQGDHRVCVTPPAHEPFPLSSAQFLSAFGPGSISGSSTTGSSTSSSTTGSSTSSSTARTSTSSSTTGSLTSSSTTGTSTSSSATGTSTSGSTTGTSTDNSTGTSHFNDLSSTTEREASSAFSVGIVAYLTVVSMLFAL